MLRELPFKTIGDIARHGLELHVYCSRCFATRRLDLEMNTDLHGRAFATTRFRCRRCGTPGMPKIRPHELLQVGGPVTLAFLWCSRCIWETDQAQLDKPPWSGSTQHYRCPGCRGRVEWHIHGPVWRPGGGTSIRKLERNLLDDDPLGRDQISRSEGLSLAASDMKSWQRATPRKARRWKVTSTKGAIMDASQIKEHMDVVGSDDQHVGTVDHVEGQRIKLARKDSGSEGKHHYIGLDKVSSVQDGRVRLACSAQEARQAWGTAN